MPKAPFPHIEYYHARHRPLYRRFGRLLCVLTVGVLGMLLVLPLRARMEDPMKFWWLSYQCARLKMPPERCVFGSTADQKIHSRPNPRCWAELATSFNLVKDPQSDKLIFAGELRRGGMTKQIAVFLHVTGGDDGLIGLHFFSVDLRSRQSTSTPCIWDARAPDSSEVIDHPASGSQCWQRILFFAGQHLNSDPSAFQSRFDADRHSGMIKGFLAADGQIHLQNLSGKDWGEWPGYSMQMWPTDDPGGV